MNKIRPCPFCGGAASITRGHKDESSLALSTCVKCMECSAVSGFSISPENAVAAWNRRYKTTKQSTGGYGEHVIWLHDGIVLILTGPHLDHVDPSSLAWNIDAETAEVTGDGRWLSLNEIRDQLWEDLKYQALIEVREEGPFDGVIHQVGNYDDQWRPYGTTEGYA